MSCREITLSRQLIFGRERKDHNMVYRRFPAVGGGVDDFLRYHCVLYAGRRQPGSALLIGFSHWYGWILSSHLCEERTAPAEFPGRELHCCGCVAAGLLFRNASLFILWRRVYAGQCHLRECIRFHHHRCFHPE